jgi:hypothetical protein
MLQIPFDYHLTLHLDLSSRSPSANYTLLAPSAARVRCLQQRFSSSSTITHIRFLNSCARSKIEQAFPAPVAAALIGAYFAK